MSPFCPFYAHCKGDERLSAQLYFLHIFLYAQGTGKSLQLASVSTIEPILLDPNLPSEQSLELLPELTVAYCSTSQEPC